MKLLIYNWRDIENPDAGGAEVFTHEVAKRLVDRGHEVTQFSAGFDGGADEEVVDGVRIVRAGNRFSVYLWARWYYRRRFRGEFDVVVDEINTRPFMTPNYVEEPVVALIHQLAREFWFYETPFPVSWLGYHWLEDRWLKQYTDVPTMTVSESTKQDLVDLGFEDVTIVPEGIDVEPLDEVPEKADVPTFLFVGRLKEAKRPHHAVEAFRYIQEEIPDAQMHVVGDGYMLEELKEQAAANGSNITFHGYVSEERKLELMKRSHVLLVPGVREGWGLVVTEANAMGTPAVGYDVHGLRDSIKDGETGMLSEPEPRALAETAVSLFETKPTSTLAQTAVEDAGTYNWDRTAGEIEDYLEAV